jgi:hypothetical protein
VIQGLPVLSVHAVLTGEHTDDPCGACGRPPVQTTVTSGHWICGSDSATFREHCAVLPPVGVVQVTRTELLPGAYGPAGSTVHCAAGSWTEKISAGAGKALQAFAVGGTTTVGFRQVMAGPVLMSHASPVKPVLHVQRPSLPQKPWPLQVDEAKQYLQDGYS